MSSATLHNDNQEGPFWDFVASLQEQGASHPFYARYQHATARAGHENGFPNVWTREHARSMPHRGGHGRGRGWGMGGGERRGQQDQEMMNATSENEAQAEHDPARDSMETDGENTMPAADEHRGFGGRHGGGHMGRGHGRGFGLRGGRARHGPHSVARGLSDGEDFHRGPGGRGHAHAHAHGHGHGHHGGRGRGAGMRGGRGGRGPHADRGIENEPATGEQEGAAGAADAEPSRRGPAGVRNFGPLPANEDNKNKFTPETDFFDHPEAFVIHMSLPGVKKQDVEVNWLADRSVLRITGTVERPGDEGVLQTIVTGERKTGAFERRIRLGNKANPASVDVEGITAKIEDGILRVEVPKLDTGYVEIKKVDVA